MFVINALINVEIVMEIQTNAIILVDPILHFWIHQTNVALMINVELVSMDLPHLGFVQIVVLIAKHVNFFIGQKII